MSTEHYCSECGDRTAVAPYKPPEDGLCAYCRGHRDGVEHCEPVWQTTPPPHGEPLWLALEGPEGREVRAGDLVAPDIVLGACRIQVVGIGCYQGSVNAWAPRVAPKWPEGVEG